MLTAMAEAAFSSCKDDRHKYQESVIVMIGDVLSGAATESQKSIEQLQEKLEDMGEMRLQREAAAQSAQAELDAKLASTRVSKFALAEDAQAFAAAKEALSAAQAALKAASRELDRHVKAKDHLLVTIADYVKPLAEGSVEAGITQMLTTSLMASLRKLGLDESMMSAIPEAIAKEPAARGTFDSSVVASLQDELDKRILASDQHMIAKETTKAEAEAKVQEAHDVFERAKEKQHQGASMYNDTRVIQQTAEGHLKLASKDLAAVEPETRATQKELAAAEKDFEDFCSGPKRDFEELRDRNPLLSSTSDMPSEVAAGVDGQDEVAGMAPDAEGGVDARTPEEESAREMANADAETNMQEAQA
jgi:chromosome segregation ATPase